MTGVVLKARMAMASDCSMRLHPKSDSLAGTHPSLEPCQSYTICPFMHVALNMNENNRKAMLATLKEMRREVVITLTMG